MKKVEKILYKIKQMIIAKQKILGASLMSYGILALNTINAHAALKDNLGNASNSTQQEVLGWVEAVGGIGILAAGVCWIIGQTKLAKMILGSVIIGYILIKFTPDLWTWFTSLF